MDPLLRLQESRFGFAGLRALAVMSASIPMG